MSESGYPGSWLPGTLIHRLALSPQPPPATFGCGSTSGGGAWQSVHYKPPRGVSEGLSVPLPSAIYRSPQASPATASASC